MAIARLTHPVRRVPFATEPNAPPGYYPVEIVAMDESLVDTWHSTVQPRIDAQYGTWPEERDPRFIRADVHWNWRHNLRLAQLHNFATRVPGNRSGKSVAWSLVLTDAGAKRFPIGMLTVVPDFNCTVEGVSGSRSFVWYLSDAPAECYHDLGIRPARGVAKVLIDTALQTRLEMGLDGASLLHADPRGGEKLLKFYETGCGMLRVDDTGERISIFRPMRPGEYFRMEDAEARLFCSKLDSNRILEV
jgi:hypothetical protein